MPKPKSRESKSKAKQHTLVITALMILVSGVSVLGSVGLFLVLTGVVRQVPPHGETNIPARMISQFLRAQHFQQLQHKKFAPSLSELIAAENLRLPRAFPYQYAVGSPVEPKSTLNNVITATPTEPNLPSLTGVLFQIGEEENFSHEICQTEAPSRIPPKITQIPKTREEFKCPEGSFPVQDFGGR